MLLPASHEYIELCQSQVSLLMQGVGATEIAVYMTEQIESDAALKPLVIYPESSNQWAESVIQYLTATRTQEKPQPLLLDSAESVDSDARSPQAPFEFQVESPPIESASGEFVEDVTQPGAEREQIVLPLMHDNTVLGILMVARFGPSWSPREHAQVEQVAQTLSMACVLDQRSQWLSRSGFEKQALLSDEHQQLSKLLHQFRNPLTALRTLGKLMLRRMGNQDPNRDFAQSIVQQSDRLEVMLQEFSQTLDVGEETIETFDNTWSLAPSPAPTAALPAAGVISGGALSMQPCWLTEILHPIIAASAGRLEEKKMKVESSLEQDLPPVQADIAAITEVFSNLFDNAIKYTPEGGRITIQLKRDQTETAGFQSVSISDTGYGIPQTDLSLIFDGKYRGIQAQSEIQGSGLGLAIAKDLILKMSGTIEAFSPALIPHNSQTGSTFIVRLPELVR